MPFSQNDPEYVSVRLAADILNLSYMGIIRLIRKKELIAQKVDGGWGWIISRESVNKKKEEMTSCKKQ